MIIKNKLLCGVSALTATFITGFLAPQAFAATATVTATATASDSSDTTVGDIVVTAEKREEKVESVPVAITAFSAQQRQILGIKSIQDMSDFAPGLVYNSIANRPYIRGIGRNTDNLATASAVAIYYNGVYDGANANTILQHSDLFIDNIEVDRGPQNALHGSNADGGVINYVSKKPTSTFYAEGRVGVESYGEEYGEAVMSGPLSDNVRFRVGGNYTTESGGYFKNLDGPSQGGNLPQGNSGNTDYAEAQIDGTIGDHLDFWGMASTGGYSTNYHTVATIGNIPINLQTNGGFTPNAFYGLCAPNLVNAQNAAACALQVAPIASGGFGQAAVLSATTDGAVASMFPGNNPTNLNPHQFIQEYTSTNHQDNDIALATNFTYHFPSFDLTYLGGYQSFNYDLNFTTAADAGLKSYQLAGAANPTAAGTCLFALGVSALGACESPLTVNPEPSTTLFLENDAFFSHEIDVTSTTSGPFQWIGGVYWYHEKYNQPVSAGVQPNQTQLANPMYLSPTITGGCPGGALICAAPANPLSAVSVSDTFLTYDSVAFFGSADYKLNDAWKVHGAVRYTDDHKYGYQTWRFEEFDNTPGFQSTTFGADTPAFDFTQTAVGANATTTYPGAGLAVLDPATGNYIRQLNGTWSAVTGEAGIDWTPDAETLAYFKYSRGYKSGGFSTFTIAANPETKAESVDAYEIGAKKTFGSVLTLNGAAFYYDYDNDQIPLSVQNAQGLIAGQLFNLKQVTNYGVELEGNWHPTELLNFNLQYSYLSAKVQDPGACFEDTIDPNAKLPGANTSGCPVGTPQTQNLKGEQLPEATPNKVSFSAIYTAHFDPGSLAASATLVWKDATYGGLFNRAYDLAPAYTQLNLRLVWTSANKAYNVIAFVDNVTNALGYDGSTGTLLLASTTGGIGDIVTNPSLIAPRTYGMEFQYRFK